MAPSFRRLFQIINWQKSQKKTKKNTNRYRSKENEEANSEQHDKLSFLAENRQSLHDTQAERQTFYRVTQISNSMRRTKLYQYFIKFVRGERKFVSATVPSACLHHIMWAFFCRIVVCHILLLLFVCRRIEEKFAWFDFCAHNNL